MKTQILVGKAEVNGRFYKVKVKKTIDEEKFTLRKMSKERFDKIVATYEKGQAAAEKYFAEQRAAMEYRKQKPVTPAEVIKSDAVEKIAEIKTLKLSIWARIMQFIKKLLGKK